MAPRTMSGKWAADASVQRSREFEDWLAERPAPARDDEEGDETYATFTKQRRVRQDADRWQERRLKQWAARGAEAPLFTPHQQVEREFKHWREARGKLYHVSNRAEFLVDRERKQKRAGCFTRPGRGPLHRLGTPAPGGMDAKGPRRRSLSVADQMVPTEDPNNGSIQWRPRHLGAAQDAV